MEIPNKIQQQLNQFKYHKMRKLFQMVGQHDWIGYFQNSENWVEFWTILKKYFWPLEGQEKKNLLWFIWQIDEIREFGELMETPQNRQQKNASIEMSKKSKLQTSLSLAGPSSALRHWDVVEYYKVADSVSPRTCPQKDGWH